MKSQVMRAVRILRVIKVLRLVGTVRMAEDGGKGGALFAGLEHLLGSPKKNGMIFVWFWGDVW